MDMRDHGSARVRFNDSSPTSSRIHSTCKIWRPEFAAQTLESPGAEEARRCCEPWAAPSASSTSSSSPLSSSMLPSSSSTSSPPSEVAGGCWCCGRKGTASREGKWAAAGKGKGSGKGGPPEEEAALLAPAEAMARRLETGRAWKRGGDCWTAELGLGPPRFSSLRPRCTGHSLTGSQLIWWPAWTSLTLSRLKSEDFFFSRFVITNRIGTTTCLCKFLHS